MYDGVQGRGEALYFGCAAEVVILSSCLPHLPFPVFYMLFPCISKLVLYMLAPFLIG